MNYSTLQFEKITIPPEAYDKAKKDHSWQKELAPGMFLMLWHANDERPAFIYELDDQDGYKYGICINHAVKEMKDLNKVVATLHDKNPWLNYMLTQIDQHPVILDSEDTYLYLSQYSLFIWTRNENEREILLSECSKAIRNLAPNLFGKYDDLASAALENESAIEDFAEEIIDHLSELKGYKNLTLHTGKLIGKWGIKATTPLLAAVSLAPGIKSSLEKLCTQHNIVATLKENADLKNELFYAIQVAARNFYADEIRGCITKAFVKTIAKKLAVALRVLGYGIQPESLKTIIRALEIDNFYGIDFNWYESNAIFNPEDFGYYDGAENVDENFWDAIDITKLI
jgi:hypothetical protein